MLNIDPEHFKIFHSPTHGALSFEQTITRLLDFVKDEPGMTYELIIGTDSMPGPDKAAEFVSAIVVHRKNRGGIYFWSKRHVTQLHTLRDRIFEEALSSIKLAEHILNSLKQRQVNEFNLIIHVDVGPNGKTKMMMNEIVGMVKGSGFDVRTKPESYGASSVADRHT